MTSIIIAALVVGVTGLIIGLFLGIANKKLAVSTDEREAKVRELLPGNNCGGCGYAGCDALAMAIVKGRAPANACPVGGSKVSTMIGYIMGRPKNENKLEKKVAFVKCQGTCDRAKEKYNYYGEYDCRKAALAPGGSRKVCEYGCLGYGSCVSVCKFDAISIVDSVAVVDKEKCRACGKCVEACPKGLIELIPYKNKYAVVCSTKEKGKAVKEGCQTGCIGCGVCKKVCERGAIVIKDNLARIDYEKCTGCGKCSEKCPVGAITKQK